MAVSNHSAGYAAMLVVDYPYRLDGSVGFSSFVLLTVDIAASIRGVSDEVTIQAAEALPRVKCLAWITSNSSYPGSSLFYVIFMLVGRGLPAAPHSFAAVPISPAPPHPDTGRAAVVPSRPFPWSDCYIHTLRDFTAPISRLHQSSEAGFLLDDSQTEHVLLAEMDDVEATEDERQAAAFAAGYSVHSGIRIRDHGSHGSVVIDGDSASDGGASSHRSLPEDTGDHRPDLGAVPDEPASHTASVRLHALEEPAEAEPEPHDEPGIVLHVEVSGILDPSVEFGTVDDFLSVVGRLNDLEAERVERAVTTRAARAARAAVSKTAAWLQGVPAASELEDETQVRTQDPLKSHDDGPKTSPEFKSPVVPESVEEKREIQEVRGEVSKGLDSGPADLQPLSDVPEAATTLQGPPDVVVAASVSETPRPPSPSGERCKDLEAGERTPSSGAPSTKPGAEASPRPWNLWTWLSLVFSRIRSLFARWRAFF